MSRAYSGETVYLEISLNKRSHQAAMERLIEGQCFVVTEYDVDTGLLKLEMTVSKEDVDRIEERNKIEKRSAWSKVAAWVSGETK